MLDFWLDFVTAKFEHSVYSRIDSGTSRFESNGRVGALILLINNMPRDTPRWMLYRWFTTKQPS